MYLGAFLFLMIFVLITPQSRAVLAGLSLGMGTFMTNWAPFSYAFLVILVAMIFAGLYVIQSWPKHVEPENPMTKYRRETPAEVEEE